MRKTSLELFALTLVLSFIAPRVACGQGLVGQPPRFGPDGKLETPLDQPEPEAPLPKIKFETFKTEPTRQTLDPGPLDRRQLLAPVPGGNEKGDQIDAPSGDIGALIWYGATGLVGVGLGVVLRHVVLRVRSRRKPAPVDIEVLFEKIDLYSQLGVILHLAEILTRDRIDRGSVAECRRQRSEVKKAILAKPPDLKEINDRLAKAETALKAAVRGHKMADTISDTLRGLKD
jgi:hypothetical protein